MMDRLIAIKDKFLAFWDKYTTKQKTLIISVVLAIFFAIVLLSYFLTRPVYTELVKLSGDTASTFDSALSSGGIDYKKESDSKGNTVFSVEQSQYSDAVLLMGENKITDTEMSWDDAFNNDMTVSSAEKQTKATLALQSSIRKGLMNFDGVEDATVYVNRPTDDGTIFSEKKETSVSASLKLAKGSEITSETAQAIAYYLANAVGNSTTDNIILTDTTGNLLYGQKEDNTLGGSVSGSDDYKEKLRNTFCKNVSNMLMKAGYDDVQIGSANIKFNMDKVTELVKTYTANEGQDQGLYSSSYNYKSTGNSGSGGVPGTDSNGDETDTMIQTTGSSNSETTLDKYNYLPNETVQNIEHEVGAVEPDQSSIGIVLTKYNVVKEETLESQGLLDNTTFEEYVNNNSAVTDLQVPQELITLVSAATGIATNNITIQIKQKPVYEAKESSSFTDNISNYLMVILTLLIAGLLVFVIIKGTSPVEVTELEPELSVEDLLATTQEDDKQNLDEIELSDKSETRQLIEKFVDENPEAVALLLRNWINEDWGA
ncbi:MAG: flagellar M-ring protein FliF C-terminal domain-containing protein [Eubacterium sp.]|nr:flagellar M-ring protein FliF C-terminal domain-containing protein [Eubacterium sp.]